MSLTGLNPWYRGEADSRCGLPLPTRAMCPGTSRRVHPRQVVPGCHRPARHIRGGFTLIEIMIVVAVLGIVLGISLPAIYKQRKAAPMVKTVKSLREVCSHARARAIFSGRKTQVVFRPYERTFSTGGGGGLPKGVRKLGTSGTIHDGVTLEMLDINLMEFSDQEVAAVTFYPNGTCDEMTIILTSPDSRRRTIVWEATTGLSRILSEAEEQAFVYGR
jgi:prepilin-type N-terminal cleavage/methylation domain-containing protein